MKRDLELDALRGLAALSVLLFHSWLILPESWHATRFALEPSQLLSLPFLLRFTPLHLLIAGPSCVAFFFVLSGYVLSISMWYTKQFHYGKFLVRRVCRIYLPFFVAIICSTIGYLAISPQQAASASRWFAYDQWSVFPSVHVVLGHLLMIGTPDFQSLDPPMWSLVIEMRVSIIFPFIYWLITAAPRAGSAALMALYFVASLFMTMQEHSVPTTFVESWAVTIEFLPFFALGILMFMARHRISARYGSLPVILRRTTLVLAIGLLGMPSIGPQTSISVVLKAVWMVGVGFGSFAAIVLALYSSSFSRVLRLEPLQWLGRVSYSLYLTHMIVLFCLVHGIQQRLPLPAILCLAFPISFGVAAIAHWLVEEPAIRLGFALTRRQPNIPISPSSRLERITSAN